MPMYSPIIALSSSGSALRKAASCAGSSGVCSRPCSCRKAMPFFGFLLNSATPCEKEAEGVMRKKKERTKQKEENQYRKKKRSEQKEEKKRAERWKAQLT